MSDYEICGFLNNTYTLSFVYNILQMGLHGIYVGLLLFVTFQNGTTVDSRRCSLTMFGWRLRCACVCWCQCVCVCVCVCNAFAWAVLIVLFLFVLQSPVALHVAVFSTADSFPSDEPSTDPLSNALFRELPLPTTLLDIENRFLSYPLP